MIPPTLLSRARAFLLRVRPPPAARRGSRDGYAMLIALILIAILTIIGATSLSVAGVDERLATHNRRHMMVVNTADAGTSHARWQVMTEQPPNEGWDTADTGNLFVPMNEAEPMYEGINFPSAMATKMSQGAYWVDAVYQKCSNPPPGYSTEYGRTQFRSDFWDMKSTGEFVDQAYGNTNPTQATVTSTLRKVVGGACKIR